YTVRGYDEETGVSGPYDKNGITYKIPVKQTVPTAQGKNTIRNFLLTGLQPVGSTMYMLGGGWDFSGSRHGSGIDSRTIGVSPLWEKFALQQTAKYNYRNHEYETRNGLDCAGYLGWTVYNTLHTTSGGPGYVMWSQSYGDNFRGRGWGTCRSIYSIKDYKAGDIMYNSEHVYIVVGQCSDGSVVLLHASPPGVMISGTYTKNWKSDSEAVRLAEYYMKKYYPAWYQKYPKVARGTYFLTDYDQFRWYVNGKGVLTDPDGYTEKSAAQILADLFR
ncbi:MAG: hypothetical protein KBT01_07940, partial [Clostridiales bacterium]|nr:hypothetical protein [Candidatus Blautia equi]